MVRISRAGFEPWEKKVSVFDGPSISVVLQKKVASEKNSNQTEVPDPRMEKCCWDRELSGDHCARDCLDGDGIE